MTADVPHPLTSIVIPCYQCADTLRRAVDSVLAQRAGDLEAVLVDDGAIDATPAICDEYAAKDPRVKVIHQPNLGLMRAWKNGVLAAAGDYVAFCDADDWLEDDYTAVIADAVRGRPADMLAFAMTVEGEDGATAVVKNRLESGRYERTDLEGRVLPRLFSDGTKHSELLIKSRWTKCFSRELLLKILPDLPDQVAIGEDWLMVFTTALNARSLVCDNAHACYHYVRRGQSMTGSRVKGLFAKFDLLYAEMFKVARKYGYAHDAQIRDDALSCFLDAIKQELRFSEDGYPATRERVAAMVASPLFQECVGRCALAKYRFDKRFLLRLVAHGHIWPAYAIEKMLGLFHH